MVHGSESVRRSEDRPGSPREEGEGALDDDVRSLVGEVVAGAGDELGGQVVGHPVGDAHLARVGARLERPVEGDGRDGQPPVPVGTRDQPARLGEDDRRYSADPASAWACSRSTKTSTSASAMCASAGEKPLSRWRGSASRLSAQAPSPGVAITGWNHREGTTASIRGWNRRYGCGPRHRRCRTRVGWS